MTIEARQWCFLFIASRVENSIFGQYRVINHSYDPVKQVLFMPWGAHFHVEEFNKILPVEIILHRYKFAQRILALELSKEEEAILRALVIVSPGETSHCYFCVAYCIAVSFNNVFSAVNRKLPLYRKHELYVGPLKCVICCWEVCIQSVKSTE